MQSRTISTADLAHLLATTPKTIATYAKLGVVKRRGRGKFDDVASIRGFAKHMRALFSVRSRACSSPRIAACMR